MLHNYAQLSVFRSEKLDIYLLFGWGNFLMSFQWEISQPIWSTISSSKNLTSKGLRADVDIDRECFPYIQVSKIRSSYLGVFNCISK